MMRRHWLDICIGKRFRTEHSTHRHRAGGGEKQSSLWHKISQVGYSLGEENSVDGMSREDLKNGTSDYCMLLPDKENKKKTLFFLYGVVLNNLPVLCSR